MLAAYVLRVEVRYIDATIANLPAAIDGEAERLKRRLDVVSVAGARGRP